MIKNKKEKKIMATKKLMMILFTLFIIVAWLFGFVVETRAETRKWRIYTYVAQMEILPVGDTEGHFLSMGIRRGLAHFADGEVAVFVNWWTVDVTKGHATAQGYALYTFEDKSTFAAKFEVAQQPGPQGLPSYKGTGKITKGTGRFEGIQGNVTIEGKNLVPYAKEKGLLADAYFDIVGTYTLPRK
jgi:hypothetical protein